MDKQRVDGQRQKKVAVSLRVISAVRLLRVFYELLANEQRFIIAL